MPQRFRAAGLYNGIALLEDLETRSYWDHITGECIHGARRGAALEWGLPLEYSTAEAAVRRYPQVEVARARRSLRARLARILFLDRMLSPRGHLMPRLFHPTMAEDDERRPRMDLGLGVFWRHGLARFYPMDTLRQRGGAIIDTVGEHRLVVYIDPLTEMPAALHCAAETCAWRDHDLVMPGGAVIRDRRLVADDGTTTAVAQPHQMFTRWYGFAATFPRCDVYAPESAAPEAPGPGKTAG